MTKKTLKILNKLQLSETKHLSSDTAEDWTPSFTCAHKHDVFTDLSPLTYRLTELCVPYGETWTHHHTVWLPHDLRAALLPPEPALALPLLCLRPVHHAGGHQRHPGGSAGLRHFSSRWERHHHHRPTPLTNSGSLLRGLLRGQQETPGPRS